MSTKLERILPNADLDRWSGGPVFRVEEVGQMESLELTGIIYEYHQGYEIIMAHPLDYLLKNGDFE